MKGIMFTILLITILNAQSNPPEAKILSNHQDVVEELKRIDEGIRSLIADFHQEIFFKTAEIKHLIEGKVFFLKPGNLKIIHTKPQQQIIIIKDLKKITIIKPSDKQIITTDWEKWKSALEPRLKGLLELGNYSKLAEKGSSEIIIENGKKLITIKSKKQPYTLKITLSSDNKPLEAELDLGETLIITRFQNIQLNTEIKESEFKYKNKEGYESLSL